MTRTIGAPLTSHIASGKTRLSRCLRLDLQDGTTLGITDHDNDLSVNLGDGALTYRADVGAIPSAISTSVGFELDNLEMSGPLGSAVTQASVLGGRFRQARARIFDVQWDETTRWYALLAGRVGEGKVEAGRFTLQIRGASDAYNQTIGRVIGPYCSHDFGQGQCQAVPETWAAEVATVTDALRFTVTWTGATPTSADVRNGTVEYDTGALAGTRPVEVFNLTAGLLEVYHPLAEPPQVGDELTVTQGCPKLRPACKGFEQILNFGGFPDVPGTDDYLPVPTPG